jgi:hypothetical protein
MADQFVLGRARSFVYSTRWRGPDAKLLQELYGLSAAKVAARAAQGTFAGSIAQQLGITINGDLRFGSLASGLSC